MSYRRDNKRKRKLNFKGPGRIKTSKPSGFGFPKLKFKR
jgi:hypothetical protein